MLAGDWHTQGVRSSYIVVITILECSWECFQIMGGEDRVTTISLMFTKPEAENVPKTGNHGRTRRYFDSR